MILTREVGSKNLPGEYYIHRKLIIKKLYQIKKIKHLSWDLNFPPTRIRKIKGITTLTFGWDYNQVTELPLNLKGSKDTMLSEAQHSIFGSPEDGTPLRRSILTTLTFGVNTTK